MENMTGSQRSNTTTKRKQMRRRSQTRRVLQDSIINMAEARREIVQALQLHRSSSSSITRRTRTTPTAISASAASEAASMLGNINKVGSSSSSQCCYYSLTQSMPVPGPIWSTTAPSIPAAAPPAAAAATECLEFEWGENQASSYSWWLGFLKTLDSNKNNTENSKYHPLHFEKFVMGNPRMFGDYPDGSRLGEGTLVDATSDQTNSSPDEWLMFPTTADHHQGDRTTTGP